MKQSKPRYKTPESRQRPQLEQRWSDFVLRPSKSPVRRSPIKKTSPVIARSKSVPALQRAKPIARSLSPATSARQTRRPVQREQQPVYRKFALLLIGVGLIIVSSQVFSRGESLPTTDTKGATISLEKPVPSPVDTTEMSQRINEVITANPSLQIGVSFVDLNAGKRQLYGVDDPYIAASTAKLLSAIMYLHQVEQGAARLEDPINGLPASEQIKQLITQSDNNVWYALNDLLGRDKLLVYARQHGLEQYDSANNTLTAGDVGILLQKLYKRELLNESNTNLILSHMQNAHQNEYIAASLPAGARVYHKAGWLKDRLHDAAIIENDKHPYVLVVFTKSRGSYDMAIGQKIFQQITVATVETMFKP